MLRLTRLACLAALCVLVSSARANEGFWFGRDITKAGDERELVGPQEAAALQAAAQGLLDVLHVLDGGTRQRHLR